MQVLSWFQALFNIIYGLIQGFAPGLLPHPGTFRETPTNGVDATPNLAQETVTTSVHDFASPEGHGISYSCSSKPWDARKRLLLQDSALGLQLFSFRAQLPLLFGVASWSQPL